MAVDEDGHIYVAGVSGHDAFLRKYDPAGMKLWAVGFGSTDEDAALGVAADGEGHVYVAGRTSGTMQGSASEGGWDAFLTKYDSESIRLWTIQFGSSEKDVAWSVAVDGWGDVYVAGRSGEDTFLNKYDPEGMELWGTRFGSGEQDASLTVAVDGHGGIYVAGMTKGNLPGQSSAGDLDAFLSKYDSEGTPVWTRQFGSHDEDIAQDVAVDAAGNAYVAGSTLGALPEQVSLGDKDAFLVKFDGAGAELWTRQFGSAEKDTARSVVATEGGDVYVVGLTQGLLDHASEGGEDIFLVRFDSTGAELGTLQLGSHDDDQATGVDVDEDGHVYIVGETSGQLPGQTSAGGSDAFVLQALQ